MKKLLGISAILLALIVIASCKKSNNTTSPYNMKASIGTFSFDAEGQTKANSSGSSSGGISLVYLRGTSTDGKVIKITLISGATWPGVGTYSVDTAGAACDYYPYGPDSTYTYATTGIVTLTAVTPNYVGTFSFTCADSTQVKNGSFTIQAFQ